MFYDPEDSRHPPAVPFSDADVVVLQICEAAGVVKPSIMETHIAECLAGTLQSLAIHPDGKTVMHSLNMNFAPKDGDTIISFGPARRVASDSVATAMSAT